MTGPSVAPGNGATLAQWLAWLEFLHPVGIELGLERVSAVAQRAGLLSGLPPLVTVAGTNGKGSVVVTLAAIYTAAGYCCGAYTSPHLVHFGERIRIAGSPVDDADIVAALALIESHRGDVSLTFFEATTLAAMQVFMQSGVDVVILEVGLGGRLDAVNIWNTDCAVVTSIAVDHESWLGSDRNTIAAEKVAIARRGCPLIVAETHPPAAISDYARKSGAILWQVGDAYHIERDTAPGRWLLTTPVARHHLPHPALPGDHQIDNSAAAIAAVDALQLALPVAQGVVASALTQIQLPGRLQWIEEDGVEILLDVAHNPAAAVVLAAALVAALGSITRSRACRVHAVLAVMADKNAAGIIAAVAACISSWHCGQLAIDRALPASELAGQLAAAGQQNVTTYASVTSALDGALECARVNSHCCDDLVLVFGSFYTVSAVLIRREAN